MVPVQAAARTWLRVGVDVGASLAQPAPAQPRHRAHACEQCALHCRPAGCMIMIQGANCKGPRPRVKLLRS